MLNRILLAAAALAVVLALPAALAQVQPGSAPAMKYPAWDGLWKRGSPPGVWDPSKPPGLGQQAPLTPEYQAVLEANIAKAKAGVEFDPKSTCGPVGMPRMMTMYEPMEIIVRPQETYMLVESMSPVRRIFTDGRPWPKNADPAFVGTSIGEWRDTDGDGTYDTLEIETRNMKGPRLFDNSGIPLARDNETVVREKLYLDKADPDILRNEITTIDHALTRPWTVTKNYRRNPDPHPYWPEYVCADGQSHVAIGKEVYYLSADGQLMPAKKGQQPPDFRYFK